MNTSVIGYPRIGKDRELKFASEKFFAGSCFCSCRASVAQTSFFNFTGRILFKALFHRPRSLILLIKAQFTQWESSVIYTVG